MEDINDKYHSYLNNDDLGASELFEGEQEMKDFLERSANLKPAEFRKSKSELWAAIEGEIEQGNESVKEVSFNWKKTLSIAAAIVILLVAGISAISNFNNAETINHIAKLKESKKVDLPDGSKVYLNAESKLSYSTVWNRTMDLSGEAFFEVTKGEKFTVSTAMGDVQVLGTSFNVSVRNNSFSVSCKTGKVKVSFANSKEEAVLLTKGESVVFEKDTVKRGVVDILKIANWKEGTFHYINRPVSEVFDEIKRQYDVEIKIASKAIAERPFEGYFFTGDLKTSLSLVCEPMGLLYKIDGTTVVIESGK